MNLNIYHKCNNHELINNTNMSAPCIPTLFIKMMFLQYNLNEVPKIDNMPQNVTLLLTSEAPV